MALNSEGIARSRSTADEVGTLSKDLKSSGESLKETLNSNGNYQYFKMGSDKGASIDKNLNRTLDTVINELVPQINTLLATIEAFLAKQEEENRRAAQARREAATKASVTGVSSFMNNISVTK